MNKFSNLTHEELMKLDVEELDVMSIEGNSLDTELIRRIRNLARKMDDLNKGAYRRRYYSKINKALRG